MAGQWNHLKNFKRDDYMTIRAKSITKQFIYFKTRRDSQHLDLCEAD